MDEKRNQGPEGSLGESEQQKISNQSDEQQKQGRQQESHGERNRHSGQQRGRGEGYNQSQQNK